jgi:hypothetical protein
LALHDEPLKPLLQLVDAHAEKDGRSAAAGLGGALASRGAVYRTGGVVDGVSPSAGTSAPRGRAGDPRPLPAV